MHRQKLVRKHKASVRAAETSEQTVHRLEQARKRQASVRASETSKQTVPPPRVLHFSAIH